MRHLFKNVLFIGPYNPFGGIGAVINTYKLHIEYFNVVYTHTNTNFFKNLIIYLKSFFVVFFKLFFNKKIKIVHLHSASRGSFFRKSFLGLLSKLFYKKVIFHIHSGSFNEFFNSSFLVKIFIKFSLNKMDSIICLSEEWKHFYKNIIKLNNVEVLGNPINMNTLQLKSINYNCINLLYLGNISEEKGIFKLIHYLRSNKYFISNRIKLKIGGLGDCAKLIKLIKEYNLSNNISYVGWVANEAKNDLINNADIFILPSFYEGLPVSILEAMSFGKPIIATNIGGIPSIVKENYNGWLFNPLYFNELDQIFDKLFKNNDRIHYYQHNSHKIASKYASHNIIDQLGRIYSNLLA